MYISKHREFNYISQFNVVLSRLAKDTSFLLCRFILYSNPCILGWGHAISCLHCYFARLIQEISRQKFPFELVAGVIIESVDFRCIWGDFTKISTLLELPTHQNVEPEFVDFNLEKGYWEFTWLWMNFLSKTLYDSHLSGTQYNPILRFFDWLVDNVAESP